MAMAFSTMTMAIILPMAGVLVHYETNCHNRTLINRLINVEVFYTIAWNLTVQLVTLVRYLAGPFPDLVCQLEYLIKNTMTLQWILLVDFVLIVRYIFVFKSKNPTAVQDEFWIVFLVIWSIGFGLICQTTYLISPGKMPMTFYFCVGKMHKSLTDVKVKNNSSFNFLVIVTTICYSYINIKFFYHKRRAARLSAPMLQQPFSNQPRIHIVMNRMNEENLFSMASNTIAFAVIVLSGIAPNVLNRTHPSMVDVYPNYLWAYLHQHFTLNFGILWINSIYFYKKPALARPIKDWLTKAFERCKSTFS